MTIGTSDIIISSLNPSLSGHILTWNPQGKLVDGGVNQAADISRSEVASISAGFNTRINNATNSINTLYSTYANSTTVASISAGLQSLKAPATHTAQISTSYTLTDYDDGATLVTTSSRVFTVNTGLKAGFGCAIKGPGVTFIGTASLTDARVSGSPYPWCAVVNTNTNAYDIVGGS